MKNNCFFVLLFVPFFLFGNEWVFSLKDSLYYESDMYAFYGLSEWKRSSGEKKKKMVEDFIVREGAYFFGKEQGINFSPSFFEKSFNRKRELLVNYVYKIEVARLAADPNRVKEGALFLNEDLLVHHILFGHEEASLRVPVKKTKEEALFLCLEVLDTLQVENFSAAALKLSDDGGVNLNKGRVGWVSWGSTPSPSFEREIFSKAGPLIGPIETDFGYHIAYIETKRPSSFSFLPPSEYDDMVLIRSCPRDIKKLKKFSDSYDSINIETNKLIFNHDLVGEVFSQFSKNKASVSSYEKNNIVALLESVKVSGSLCVYGQEGFGLSWFIERLKKFSPSNRPPITDLSSFYSTLRTLLLQESAYLFGVKNSYEQRDVFQKQFLSYQKDLMYNMYFKSIVNGVERPDSSLVYNYYVENKDKKYKTQKSLKLQEIVVPSWQDADIVLNKYINGEDFSVLAETFSLSWTSQKKGGLGPVEKNFKKGELASLFSKDVGFVSDIYKNEDGTYSLYLIKKVYPSSYIPYKKVYSRISSFLHKTLQEEEKEKAVSSFYKNLKIIINEDIF